MKTGILGGTFDPIHNGHLAIAEAVMDCLGLERVLFIPAGRPWLKTDQRVTDAEHRLEMARLATGGRPHFEVSPIEVERPGLTYTVDTLAELRRDMEDGAELYLILGMDSVRELQRWRQPERLFELCTVVAVSRPETDDLPLRDLEAMFPAARGRVHPVRGPMTDVSATEIRTRIADGLPIDHLVPGAVRHYIRDHCLYA